MPPEGTFLAVPLREIPRPLQTARSGHGLEGGLDVAGGGESPVHGGYSKFQMFCIRNEIESILNSKSPLDFKKHSVSMYLAIMVSSSGNSVEA